MKGNNACRQQSMEHIYSFYSPFYDFIFGWTLEQGRRIACRYIQNHRSIKVLEVGVGTGLTLGYYPNNCTIWGIDISAKMLDRARVRADKLSNGNQVILKRMDATHLEFPDNSFDAVLSPYVITTVEDPLKVCREMLRVCKPGGQIIVVNHTKSHKLIRGSLEKWFSPMFTRLGFATDMDVLHYLMESGIRIETVEDCNLLRLHKVVIGSKAV
jgi:phosphatidylethanolamine/phosphatidyl-N-methylethanolamine N-methyltransferase